MVKFLGEVKRRILTAVIFAFAVCLSCLTGIFGATLISLVCYWLDYPLPTDAAVYGGAVIGFVWGIPRLLSIAIDLYEDLER